MNIEYPKVSICMPTYNRNHFLPLMIFNLKGFIYPDKSRLEWVIDDDGTEPLFKGKPETFAMVKKLIHPITINYKHNNLKKTIGQKRNNMVKQANYKHIICMDSDDLYMPSYIQYSIEFMKQNQFSLVGSNQMIFLYPYKDFKITGIKCEHKRQIHEATMCFTKQHHKMMGGFQKRGTGEGAKMIDHAAKNCGVTNIELLMICVCHNDNTVKKDQFIKEDGSNAIQGTITQEVKDIINQCIEKKPSASTNSKSSSSSEEGSSNE